MTLATPALSAPFRPLRFALRELRGGLHGFRIFIACIALGVTVIAGVSSFSRSLTDGLTREGRIILGGGSSSRMFANIREKEGFAYDAHAEQNPNREAATFVAVTQVRNEVVEPALTAVLAHLDQMGKTQVSAQELSDAKNFISGNFVMDIHTRRPSRSTISSSCATQARPDCITSRSLRCDWAA